MIIIDNVYCESYNKCCFLYNLFEGEFTETKEFINIVRTKEISYKYANGCRDNYEKEIHTNHEIFYLINGDADFICSKGRKKISSGTLVLIPKDTFHQFHNNIDDLTYTRCVLKFDQINDLNSLILSKMKEVCLIKDSKIDLIFKEFISVTQSNYSSEEQTVLIKALLAQLLVSISAEKRIETQETHNYNTAYAIMAYINQNITRDISVESIAGHFYISTPYLFRLFRAEFNTSVHKYILENRLIIAHKMISKSVPASTAAKECGFSSYPNFYRQYKKMFGVNPANKSPDKE